MSKQKSERLVNLLILLLSVRHFVTKLQIREIIEGYRDLNDAAFERMFERDKAELRDLGIPLRAGSVDEFFDEAEGYRIERGEFELPPVQFSPEELAVLGTAARVWQDSVAAKHTGEAISTLEAAGVPVTREGPQTLVPRLPTEPGFDAAWAALLERRELSFDYRGKARRVQPWRLLQRQGRWYLLAMDLGSGEPRTFKLARFETPPTPVGKKDAYQSPSPEQVAPHARFDGRQERIDAVIAVPKGSRPVVLRAAETFEAATVPWPDYDGYRLSGIAADWLLAEALQHGPDLLVVEPAELRREIAQRLRTWQDRWAS
ncbi:MAG: DNA-binding transcriptional regulator [Arachnia propionica]|nr:MAG: DNA-binding transcriptional regulator [Arachnia propionica]